MEIKERNHGLDLLRLLAMIFIVMSHIEGQSGIFSNVDSEFGKCIVWFLTSGAQISVNCFVMIGAWFLVDKKFKMERIMKIYGELFFYCVSITIFLTIIFPHQVSAESIIRGLFPFMGSPLWFATCYILLLLFSGFLNQLLEFPEITKKVILILFFIHCIPPTFLLRNDFFFGSELMWFIFLYLLMGYLKKKPLNILNKGKINGVIAIGIYVGLYIVYLVIEKFMIPRIPLLLNLKDGLDIKRYFVTNYHVMPVFFCSIFLFFYFKDLKIKKNVLISFFSESTFAVYIIHQIPAFINILWFKVYQINRIMDLEWGKVLVYFFFMVITLFLSVAIIDKIRRKFIEPMWIKSKLYTNICKSGNIFFGSISKNENKDL